jgi:hypothetical protein
VKLTKCQNHHHHGGVFHVWTKWARPQAEWALGQAGRPNSLASQPGFEAVQPEPWLPRVYKRRRSPSCWRPLHPAGWPPPSAKLTSPSRWRSDSPLEIPPLGESRTPHSFCSSPLVVVAHEKPCRESSLRSSFRSSLGDQ